MAAKDTTLIQLKDELKQAKIENEALAKINQSIQSDIIKNERYKKVNTVEQELLHKTVELLKETSLSLKQELAKLQSTHDIALKKLHQSNDDNTRLSKALQDLTLQNSKLKESMANEKLITIMTKAEQSTHNQQLSMLRSTCQRLHDSNAKLLEEKNTLYTLNQGLEEAVVELRKVCRATVETLSQAKIHHTNLVNSQNEITQKKDNEISNLMEKVLMLQMLVDSRSDSKISDIGVELGLDLDVLIDTDNAVDYKLDEHESNPVNTNRPNSKADAHNIETPPSKISQPPSKKVTFLNTLSNTNDIIDTSNSNKRKSHEISTKGQDYIDNNNDNTKTSLCPSCYEHPYGLMTTCKQCTQQFHSSCAKKLSHYSKTAFICDSCYEQSL